jgi:hypothetical protein
VQKQITLTSDNTAVMKAYSLTTRLLIVALFFFVSCSPYVEIVKVDVLNPSTSTFSFVGKDVAIVGNLYEIGNGEYLYDSTLVAAATLGIKETLEQSPVFEGYEIPIYYTYSSDTALVGKPITKEDVEEMSSDMGVDMFISVDYIDILGKAARSHNDTIDLEHLMMYAGLFRVYEAGNEKPYSPYYIRNETPETVIIYNDKELPILSTTREAGISLAYRLGDNYAMFIAPYWETVERVYYVYPDDEYGSIKLGDRYVQQGSWAKAMEAWSKTITSSTKKMQVAMAAFNMAVGCEMIGNLELAKEWLGYCQKQQQSKINPAPYMQTIIARIQDKYVLDKKLQVAE